MAGAAGSRMGWLISLASSAARSRPRVMRATISPMSVMPKCGVMSPRSVAEVRCCSGHVPAVGDQRADEGEEAPGAGGCVGAGGRPILVGIGTVGWAGSGGRGGHGPEQEHIGRGCVKENIP